MIFTDIPLDGASWNGPLRYAFAGDTADGVDAEILILNEEDGSTLGRKYLRNVVDAEIDAAPYVRRAIDIKPYVLDNTGFAYAEGAMLLAVEVNGVKSGASRIFRSEYDPSRAKLFSAMPRRRTISWGEVDMMTLYAPYRLTAVIEAVTEADGVVRTSEIHFPTDSTPCDFFLRTADYPSAIRSISVIFCGEGEPFDRVDYRIEPRCESARRLVWYNRMGGLECYTYPLSRPVEAVADVVECAATRGAAVRVVDAYRRVRLQSAYETRAMYEALSEVLFSAGVWIMREGELYDAVLLTRRTDCPEPQQPAGLSLDLKCRLEGGVR